MASCLVKAQGQIYLFTFTLYIPGVYVLNFILPAIQTKFCQSCPHNKKGLKFRRIFSKTATAVLIKFHRFAGRATSIIF
jgi:hypothetical protein